MLRFNKGNIIPMGIMSVGEIFLLGETLTSIKREKRKPIHIPFQHIVACPKCGSRELRVIHNRKYPDQDGIVQLVIYRCPNGHEFNKRQLVVRQFNVPPKEDWEGWR